MNKNAVLQRMEKASERPSKKASDTTLTPKLKKYG